jgi:IS5 family transposase
MLRVHFMQQWFTLSDPAMEEALHDMPLFREFAGLNTAKLLQVPIFVS